ncbi:hypothetical protein MHTCC0001_14170 [Flavobacteriaceae bacterium MHTCC 0001]
MSIGFSQTKELDSLTLKLGFETSDSLKVDTTLKIVEHLLQLKDYNLAIQYIKAGEQLSKNINYKEATAKAIYYKALIYAEKNDYINAMDGYSKAKTMFNELGDTLNLAKVNNSIGLIEIERGNYDKGLNYTLSAVRAFERKGMLDELKSVYTGLGTAYYKINNVNKAISYNLKALEIQEQLNDQSGVIKSCLYLAKLYSQGKEHRKSIEFYEKALTIDNGKTKTLRGDILPSLGGEYLQFNDYEKAAKYLVQGVKLNRRNRNETNLLVSLNNLASLNLSQDDLKTARKQLTEARVLARKIKDQNELLRNYNLMKALDSTQKNFASAFVWQRRYYTLKDSLNKAKNTPAKNIAIEVPKRNLDFSLVDNNTSEEISTKDLNKAQIITDSERRNLDKLNQYKVFFYILLGILAIVSVFLILVYLKRINSLKYAKGLEERNLKIQLQNEAFVEQTKHLENVNSVKDKLFSIVSHDLKDSLLSINGFIDLLRDGSLSREEFDNLVPELSENANNASLLLFNLLNWSKSQMQSLKPSPSLFNIQEVFEEKIKLIEQRLETKGIELVDHSTRNFAYADKSMFEIVIQNLLANALKFSRRNDTITISNHNKNGSCIISVADTGIGIAEDNLEKLFKNDAYTTMGTNNEKGTGLGLSICKELVELNGGEIWAESTVDVGSIFFVQLPNSKPSNN